MTRWAGLAAVVLIGLVACDRDAASPAPPQMSDRQLTRELERCRGLGLKVYDDDPCRKAQQERTRRFYAKPSEAVR